MRNFFSWLAIGGGKPRAAAVRPEESRRRTIGANARVILAMSTLALPIAAYLLWVGMLMPFVLGVVGIAAGFLSVALHRRGNYDCALAAQVYGTQVVGLVLAVADPALADFGLAVALLGAVHASLLTYKRTEVLSWVGVAVVAAAAALSSGGVALWPEAYRPEFSLIGGLAFVGAACIVVHSANRLSSIFEVYEKAQITAYRHLIENVQDAVLSFGTDGSLLFASRSAEQLFGCPRYELTGPGLRERVHLLDRPAYLSVLAAASTDGKASTIEVRMRRDDSAVPMPTYVWVEISLSPVVEGVLGGERCEIVALLRDVTARRDQEHTMRQARQQAEDASSAKSHVLATIGHELRTPLSAIVGFSEMMTSGTVGELAPKHREYVGHIHRSSLHLIEVVNMLLDASRIEAGRFELHTDEFAPDALIEPCLQIVRPLADEHEIRLVTKLAPQLPPILADERACRQVLINLLSNAVKFSKAGASVTLALRRQGQHLNLSVTDSGVGMDQDALKRIGEPFFQAHSGLARGYEGTGLGLSIVKGIVELHDGTLHATSAPGEGTVMTVLLPINGPATKPVETGEVTSFHRSPVNQHMPLWQDDARKRAL